MKKVTKDNIIKLLIRHSNEAYEYLYVRYYAALKVYCLNYLDNEQEAEDIVQEIFVNLLDVEIKFNTEEELRMYLYRSVKNKIISSIRHLEVCNKYTIEMQAKNDIESHFYEEMIKKDVSSTLHYAISQLSPRCAQVMELFLEGYNQTEIAKRLCIKVDTVNEYKAISKKKMKIILTSLDMLCIILFFPMFYFCYIHLLASMR